MFTIIPFGSARADRLWPDQNLLAYAAIVAIAVALTASATVGATRRSVRGPATA
ncbi:hypothetical protein BJ973_001493 [Actinoplanes tereljensis]|uniref:Uncharacterized protein n=1 Tax=Paractinoplanes tereljensis TaxID=571912 RepID=A0A919TU31_9ACTN|nr:hypothetical protein [Actinoplanes tereljensis]GIF20602.1 hypothetical protein Ate02nite_33320 [Actinoplanes tereljensis]